ncbi:MAG: hypothetical protein AAF694_05565 [Bacteroidota bacterium]
MGKMLPSTSIEQTVEVKKKTNSIFMALFITTILFSCSQLSTDTTETYDAATTFNEELAIPDFTISTIRDSTDFSSKSIPKEGILLIKYFSTDCDNCQEEAERYFSKKDSLQNIKTMWISGDWSELKLIKEFTEKYKLEQLNAIAIGKETNNFLVSHFEFTGVPFAAVYHDNQLIKEYKGALDFSELIALNNGKILPDRVDPLLPQE